MVQKRGKNGVEIR